jgi:drug/metabolite transporter (DMT)-like permease
VLRLFALAGVVAISFSAVFVRLANVSPVTAAFYRAAYALPLLFVLAARQRARDDRSGRARMLAGLSGILLAIDLGFWHQSIALIGVGLATVIANVQVVFVAMGAWLLHGERPRRETSLLVMVVLVGLLMTSGLARADAYGSAPALGTLFGVLAGASYASYLLMFRAANRSLGDPAGPLFDATIGVTIGALIIAPVDPRFSLAVSWPAHGWLVLLALVSQVAGWMFIATALPRLPAIETSILLLVQPVFAFIWGVVIFDEHLSILQWLGSAIVLGGVAMVARLTSESRATTARSGTPSP